jgi:hypothetical protein
LGVRENGIHCSHQFYYTPFFSYFDPDANQLICTGVRCEFTHLAMYVTFFGGKEAQIKKIQKAGFKLKPGVPVYVISILSQKK